jgi:hypothetical protein
MARPTLAVGATFLRRRHWGDYAGVAVLALLFVASVWPIVRFGSIPAFQQDWSWPLSRGLALQWLHGFVGMWDDRALGQPNLLPWQGYAVLPQAALVLALGPSYGLAAWIVILEAGAAAAFIAMLRAFGITSRVSAYSAALLYAVGPVFFTRLQAGHFAYLVGYALLPLVVALARRLAAGTRARTILLLGVLFGLSCSQIQFLFIAPLAVAVLAACTPELRGRRRELLAAAAVGLALQLPLLLPLALSGAANIYENQRALVSWEYNLSAYPANAAVMLGYFTHYYESHAVSWIAFVLYPLCGSAFVVAFAARRRLAAFAALLWLFGWVATSGLYGPLSVPLAWAFERAPIAGVFRDLNYFAALTSLGICLAVAIALNARAILAAAYLPLVAIVVLPAAMGAGLGDLIASPRWISDSLSDMQAIQSHGPGRVVWLPAEEPLGPVNGSHAGRDLVAYAPSGNATVSFGSENRALAYALWRLREGEPEWQLFSRMGIRYLVDRHYLRIADLASRMPIPLTHLRLALLRSSPYSDVYELPAGARATLSSVSASAAMLFSELEDGSVALLPARTPSLNVGTSVESADPRRGWVSSAVTLRAPPWLFDSIYPFAWTASAEPEALQIPTGVRCLLIAAPSGAELSLNVSSYAVRGTWKRYFVGDGSGGNALLRPHGLTAIARVPCDIPEAAASSRRYFVMSQTYDAGWRVLARGRMIAPTLADGWMMAWPLEDDGAPAIYLPAVAQVIGLIAGALIIAFAAFTCVASAPSR